MRLAHLLEKVTYICFYLHKEGELREKKIYLFITY